MQTCEVGEIGWIDPAEESDEPAPRVRLTPNDQPILSTTTTVATATTQPPATTATATSPEDGEDDDGSDGGDDGFPTWLAGLAALLVAGGVALVASRRRAARS